MRHWLHKPVDHNLVVCSNRAFSHCHAVLYEYILNTSKTRLNDPCSLPPSTHAEVKHHIPILNRLKEGFASKLRLAAVLFFFKKMSPFQLSHVLAFLQIQMCIQATWAAQSHD